MKELLQKILPGDLTKYTLLFFALFPVIPNNLKGLPVILLALTVLLQYKPVFSSGTLKKFFCYASLFFIFLFSFFRASHFTAGKSMMETALPAFILPMIFILFPIRNITDFSFRKKFMYLYIFSASLYSFLGFIAIIFSKIPLYKDYYIDKFRRSVQHMPYLGQHPIYASLLLAIGLIFIVYLWRENKKNRLVLSFAFILQSTLLIMLSSKGIIFSLFILIIVYSFIHFKYDYKKITGILLLFFVFLFALFHYNRRMKELLNVTKYQTVNSNYSTSYRIQIYDCVKQVIGKQWLWGYGLDQVQAELNACYKEKSKLLLAKTYNSHNQFLDVWLKGGLPGFLIFLCFSVYLFVQTLRTKNYLLFSLLFIFYFNMIFENLLVRRTGVVMFYFLILFFAQTSFKKDRQ